MGLRSYACKGGACNKVAVYVTAQPVEACEGLGVDPYGCETNTLVEHYPVLERERILWSDEFHALTSFLLLFRGQ